MGISESDLLARVYKLCIYYRDVGDKVQVYQTRLYASSKRGALRRATNLVNDWVQENSGDCFVCGAHLSAELGSWDVHRLYDKGVAFTPWVDDLPLPTVQ